MSLAFLVLALLESLPLRASGARLLERDLILESLAFFISLPLRAFGARLLERDLVLVNTPLGASTPRLILARSAMDLRLAFACCDNLVFVGRRPTERRIKNSICFEVFWFG